MALLLTNAAPSVVVTSPGLGRPRFWATAWTLGSAGKRWSANTLKTQLRHIDRFYQYCDDRFGTDALDTAIGGSDAAAVQRMAEVFYTALTSNPSYTSTDVQCWDTVRALILHFARHRAVYSEAWRALTAYIEGTGCIRSPKRGRFKFARALPEKTLADLLAVAEPGSDRNPFSTTSVQWRNWVILHLLLLCGLRRGEALLLAVDSLKHDVDPHSGEIAYWLDVTTIDDEDDRSTRPSIKTGDSHRQVPVSAELAALLEYYIAEVRIPVFSHAYLLTAQNGRPLSAESVNKMLVKLSNGLTLAARKRFEERTGGKTHVSPHDLRHTCATARYGLFIAQEPDRELAMQRMRGFFGWSIDSEMPAVYARAAIHDDLLRSWNSLFDQRVRLLRKGER